MRPGHPFDTATLDERRVEQRRALRLLPASLVAEAAPRVGPDPASVADDDRPFVESLLRAEAAELLGDRVITKLVEGWRVDAQVETLDDFYERNRARAEDLAIGPQAAFFDQADLARLAQRDRETTPLPVDHAPKLRRLLLLLVWADHLSGYADPRLADLSEDRRPGPAEGGRHEVPPPPGVGPSARSGDTAELRAVPATVEGPSGGT